MKLFKGLCFMLIVLIGVQIAAAQSTFKPGDRVIVTAQKLPVFVEPKAESAIVRELVTGMSSTVIATQVDGQNNTWVYLLEGVYGWVELSDPRYLVAYSNGALTKIINDATTTLSSDPNNTDAYLARGEAEATQKNYDAAINDLTQAISITSDDDQTPLIYYRGVIYLDAGQYAKAQDDAEDALDHKYTFPVVDNLLTAAESGRGDQAGALTLAQAAVNDEPTYGLAYLNLAANQYNNQDYEDGIQSDLRALQLDPNLLIAYTDEANAYEKLNKNQEALDTYNAVIAKAPFYAPAYVDRADWYGSVPRDYTRALADYNQAIKLDPSNDIAFDERGVNYAFMGDGQDALNDLKQAIALNPNNTHAHFTLAGLYADFGYYQLGIDQYTSIINNPTPSTYTVSAQLYRPQLYIALGNYASAMNDLNSFLKNSSDDFSASSNSGSSDNSSSSGDLGSSSDLGSFDNSSSSSSSSSSDDLGASSDLGASDNSGSSSSSSASDDLGASDNSGSSNNSGASGNSGSSNNSGASAEAQSQMYFQTTGLILRASLYARTSDFTDASADLQRILNTQPDFAKYYFAVGGGYRSAPMRQNDITKLQQTASARPQNADAQLQYGAIDIEFGLWQQAHDAFAQYEQDAVRTFDGFDDFEAALQQLAS